MIAMNFIRGKIAANSAVRYCTRIIANKTSRVVNTDYRTTKIIYQGINNRVISLDAKNSTRIAANKTASVFNTGH